MHPHFNREYYAHAKRKNFAEQGYSRRQVRPKYNVPVNISESEDGFEVSVYATGFEKENIKINVSGDRLVISGTRIVDESTIPVFVKQEFPVRVFERVIGLSEKIDRSGITARQENNILYVFLPKTREARTTTREIEIS